MTQLKTSNTKNISEIKDFLENLNISLKIDKNGNFIYKDEDLGDVIISQKIINDQVKEAGYSNSQSKEIAQIIKDFAKSLKADKIEKTTAKKPTGSLMSKISTLLYAASAVSIPQIALATNTKNNDTKIAKFNPEEINIINVNVTDKNVATVLANLTAQINSLKAENKNLSNSKAILETNYKSLNNSYNILNTTYNNNLKLVNSLNSLGLNLTAQNRNLSNIVDSLKLENKNQNSTISLLKQNLVNLTKNLNQSQSIVKQLQDNSDNLLKEKQDKEKQASTYKRNSYLTASISAGVIGIIIGASVVSYCVTLQIKRRNDVLNNFCRRILGDNQLIGSQNNEMREELDRIKPELEKMLEETPKLRLELAALTQYLYDYGEFVVGIPLQNTVEEKLKVFGNIGIELKKLFEQREIAINGQIYNEGGPSSRTLDNQLQEDLENNQGSLNPRAQAYLVDNNMQSNSPDVKGKRKAEKQGENSDSESSVIVEIYDPKVQSGLKAPATTPFLSNNTFQQEASSSRQAPKPQGNVFNLPDAQNDQPLDSKQNHTNPLRVISAAALSPRNRNGRDI